VPELAKTTTFTRTALWSGAIWALYHYPAIVFTDYHASGSRVVSFTAFTVLVFAAGVILTWVRLRSGSVWPAVIFHASHNLFVQDVFDRLTVSKPGTEYVTTEFGVGLAVVYGIVAWYLWRRRGELAAPATAAIVAEAPPQAVATATGSGAR
jgi:membrane protease YdiL (CAAX protease family)